MRWIMDQNGSPYSLDAFQWAADDLVSLDYNQIKSSKLISSSFVEIQLTVIGVELGQRSVGRILLLGGRIFITTWSLSPLNFLELKGEREGDKNFISISLCGKEIWIPIKKNCP